MGEESQITVLLQQLRGGDAEVQSALMAAVYAQLRALAASYFRGRPSDHTLQPTAVVHEAWIRLARADGQVYNSRSHFFAVAATAMRQILADHARRSRAAKRGGGWERVTLSGVEAGAASAAVDLLELEQLLNELESLNTRHARLLELRVFGGLTMPECAEILEVSTRTLENDWRYLKAWMRRRLAIDGAAG